ncbi:MAG TPA: sigma-E processing peptidase SpoIIGA [Symbiobacteriaceae bacterium]|nr:sigma-E processing peptidase SpoIIGA [Symbiobacteriaceae bacterium]
MAYWYINVDVAFLLNFLADLVWLWATAALTGVPARRARLAAAAAVGAAAAVWGYFPTGRWLATPWGGMVGSAVILALALAPLKGRQAARAAACFILSGGAMAGGVVMATLWREGEGYPPATVAAGVMVAALGLRYLWVHARERSRQTRGLYGLRITIGGQAVTLPALLDTGNHLSDPLTSTPVAVVEAGRLKGLLPREVTGALKGGWEALERLPGSWAARCRLVPYRSVGQPEGMLLAVQPDEVAVQEPGTDRWEPARGLIGLAGFPLHPEGLYGALLPHRWLRGGQGQ